MPLVFITGAGHRIGRGLAINFARKAWDVIIHYNNSDSLAEETLDILKYINVNAYAVRADLRSKEQTIEAYNEAVKAMGVPDVLVNNAGIFTPRAKLEDITEEMWNESHEINLRAQLFTSQQFAVSAKDGARIINIASLGAQEIWKQRIPYNVSKSGVITLTKALARELAPRISVNCVCPGAIKLEEEPSSNDVYLIPKEKIPMQRYGNVDDIFSAVYFFAAGSEYITGQVINVDGGYNLVK